MMTVLDGRDSHKVPTVTKIDNYKIIETLKTYDEDIILCLMIDGFYVPCVKSDVHYTIEDYDWVLCASYKTYRGFKNWFKRMYADRMPRDWEKEMKQCG